VVIETHLYKHVVPHNLSNYSFRIQHAGVLTKTILLAMVRRAAPLEGNYKYNPFNKELGLFFCLIMGFLYCNLYSTHEKSQYTHKDSLNIAIYLLCQARPKSLVPGEVELAVVDVNFRSKVSIKGFCRHMLKYTNVCTPST
jgi:hypothetical protein